MSTTTQAVASLQAEVNRLRHELQTVSAGQDSSIAGETMYVGQYLVERIVQLGITVRIQCILSTSFAHLAVQKMFGVPGDFNLGESHLYPYVLIRIYTDYAFYRISRT